MAKGIKTGGRVKGTPNKASEEFEQALDAYRDPGREPMDILMTAIRDAWEKGDTKLAIFCARKVLRTLNADRIPKRPLPFPRECLSI